MIGLGSDNRIITTLRKSCSPQSGSSSTPWWSSWTEAPLPTRTRRSAASTTGASPAGPVTTVPMFVSIETKTHKGISCKLATFFLHIQNFGFYKIYQKEVTLFNTAQAKTQNLYDIDQKEKGNVNCALWDQIFY